ncbi:MAG TPA: transcription termination factor Rho [Gemmatimonadaceae bacterium]
MSERRRPPRRGRSQRPSRSGGENNDNPYRDDQEGSEGGAGGGESAVGTGEISARAETIEPTPRAERPAFVESTPAATAAPEPPVQRTRDEGVTERGSTPIGEYTRSENGAEAAPAPAPQGSTGYAPQRDRGERGDRGDRGDHRDHRDRGDRGDRGGDHERRNGRRHRRGRGRGQRRDHQQGGQGQPQGQQQQQPAQIVATGETRGWFDPARDAGFVRRPANSYLAENGDAYVPPHVVRQFALRRADLVDASIGFDQRGRPTVVEIRTVNDVDPAVASRRPDFNSLPASYPERKLFMETGRPAKGGPELTRRAIDLIAPIGYGQRALIVAPARAGKTTLLHAITEGVAVNHPNAVLLILLVDERPEEVSEAISWGVGEVISSSFDQPAQRHVEVTEMVLNRAHRLVESGKDVVIVLDSLTRMARAHNTAERGTGRTLSGGLDATAMAKPKAFFGSARSIPQTSGGGSLTIIATALVETGSRMDDVIFEEFKGTGNCEIKLDRSLAEKRIYPAIDIGTSGTRREEKLFRPDQIDSVYTLRRGLSQMPPQSAMEWLIKRIAATVSNDSLLAGL